jgi:small subunit ribosomal protein S21
VVLKEGETVEGAIRRFKRKCEKAGVLSELKKRQHYEKPSVKRKKKALAARKKLLKRLAQERKLNA